MRPGQAVEPMMMQSCNPCSTDASAYLNIMIEGCCHGELERIYASLL